MKEELDQITKEIKDDVDKVLHIGFEVGRRLLHAKKNPHMFKPYVSWNQWVVEHMMFAQDEAELYINFVEGTITPETFLEQHTKMVLEKIKGNKI